MGISLYTPEQVGLLMLIAGSDNPTEDAVAALGRWRYILGVAEGARLGLELDSSLPQVIKDYDYFSKMAASMVAALEEWLAEHHCT